MTFRRFTCSENFTSCSSFP